MGAGAMFAWERGPVHLDTYSAMQDDPSKAVNIAATTREVEEFLESCHVEQDPANRLRMMTPSQQRMILDRGPIATANCPSAILMSRIRDVEFGRCGGILANIGGATPAAAMPPTDPRVEELIAKYKLDVKVANFLRKLNSDQQKLALDLDLSRANNPSAIIMTQLTNANLEALGPVPSRDRLW